MSLPLLFIHFIYSSEYMLIPYSKFILPPPQISQYVLKLGHNIFT